MTTKVLYLDWGLNGNTFNEETKKKINFDKESHMKSKVQDTMTDDSEDLNKAIILEPEEL